MTCVVQWHAYMYTVACLAGFKHETQLYFVKLSADHNLRLLMEISQISLKHGVRL